MKISGQCYLGVIFGWILVASATALEGLPQDDAAGSAADEDSDATAAVTSEDEVFWQRFLTWGGGDRDWNWNHHPAPVGNHFHPAPVGNHYHNNRHHHHYHYSFPQPVPRPYPQPVPQPVPVPPPRVDCITDVDVTCRLQSTGQPCSSLQARNSNCNEVAIFTMRICNIGPVEMLVTEAQFSFEGVTDSVLLSLPFNPVPVGQCAEVNPRRGKKYTRCIYVLCLLLTMTLLLCRV